MKVVLDTNVVFAAFAANGLCAELVEEVASQCEIVSSRELLSELSHVLRRKIGIGPATGAALREYRELCTLVKPPGFDVPVCRDPDDDRVLATALAGEVDFIVTGDSDLLVLESFHGIRIVSPRQFLEIVSPR